MQAFAQSTNATLGQTDTIFYQFNVGDIISWVIGATAIIIAILIYQRQSQIDNLMIQILHGLEQRNRHDAKIEASIKSRAFRAVKAHIVSFKNELNRKLKRLEMIEQTHKDQMVAKHHMLVHELDIERKVYLTNSLQLLREADRIEHYIPAQLHDKIEMISSRMNLMWQTELKESSVIIVKGIPDTVNGWVSLAQDTLQEIDQLLPTIEKEIEEAKKIDQSNSI